MEQNVNSGMQGIGLLMIVFFFFKKSFYVIYIFYVHFLKWVFILFVVRKKSKKGEKGLLSLKHFLDANTASQNYLHQFFLGIGVIERQRQVVKKKE